MSAKSGKVSIFIRLSYSFLMILHIPYFFFSVKEYVLVLFDEVMNRSMSQHLEQKLAEMINKKNDGDDEDTRPLKEKKEPTKKLPQTPASRAGSNPFQSIETDNMIEKSDLDSNAGGKEREQDKLDTILSEISASSNKSALQYKKLSDRCFFWTAIVLHLALVVTAMLVENLDTVIEFTGAIGCSSNLFLFPGLAYILALRKYGTPH